MKWFKSMGILLALAVILTACNSQKDEQCLELKKENQDLMARMAFKDSLVDNFMASLNAIEENLVTVRSKQRLLEEHARTGKEVTDDTRKRIMTEIGMIDQLLQENEGRIEAFRQELKRSDIRINSFRETINTLNDILLAREEEMDTLKTKLVQMNLEAEVQDYKIGSLQEENRIKDSVIIQKTDLLNEGYVAIADANDLLEKGVIEKKGGILGIGSTLTLSNQLDLSRMNKIDVTEAKGFSFNARKAKVISVHPEGSYELIGDDHVFSLLVDDPDSFWSRSKLLVVATKE